MANPVWQIVNNSNNASGTSYTGTCPTGTATNDLMVAHIWARTNVGSISATPTLPWTIIRGPDVAGSIATEWLYYRIATSSDVAGTTTYTWTGTGVLNNVAISRITGADTTSPIDGNADGADAGSQLTHTANAVSPVSIQALLFYFFGAGGNTTGTVTAPLTEQYDLASGAGTSQRQMYGATENLSASGSTGTRVMTSAATTQGVNLMIAIAPPAAAAAVAADIYYAPQPITLY